MVLSSALVSAVARVSAEACQYLACNPERLSGEQLMDLLCCLPLHHLRRLAVCLFSFFCFPVTPDHYAYHYRYDLGTSSSSSSSDSDDDDGGGYDSHSD